MNRNRRRSGFTLVELLVVLAILVLLIALVGPRILGSQQRADIQQTQTQIANFESALKLFAVDNRSFPSSEEGLDALMQMPSDERLARNWDGPYLDSDALPLDPWGNEFRYTYPPDHGHRDFPNIWSLGPDGEEGTEDDITNWTSEQERTSVSDGQRAPRR